tara:strand:+ start:5415 stop:5609 length:195 start_codon:yes stop_codon:yes gene_type:complete
MKATTKKPRQRFNGKLRFCNSCKYVWEISTEGTCLRYGNMPSYKLPRVTCKKCDNNLTKRNTYD